MGGSSKGRILGTAAVLVALGLALTTLTWVRGRVGDALAPGEHAVSGSSASPAMSGLLLVVVLAVVGLLLGGRLLRAVAAGLALAAALGALALAIRVVTSPATAISDSVAPDIGRTSVQVESASVTITAWAGVLVLVLLVAAVARVAVATRSWSGISTRYERPAGEHEVPTHERGARGEVRTDWDEITEGHDPTLRDQPPSDLTQ